MEAEGLKPVDHFPRCSINVQQGVRAITKHWCREVARKMASHTRMCPVGEPDVPMCLHVYDPRPLSGFNSECLLLKPRVCGGGDLAPCFISGGNMSTGYFKVCVVH